MTTTRLALIAAIFSLFFSQSALALRVGNLRCDDNICEFDITVDSVKNDQADGGQLFFKWRLPQVSDQRFLEDFHDRATAIMKRMEESMQSRANELIKNAEASGAMIVPKGGRSSSAEDTEETKRLTETTVILLDKQYKDMRYRFVEDAKRELEGLWNSIVREEALVTSQRYEIFLRGTVITFKIAKQVTSAVMSGGCDVDDLKKLARNLKKLYDEYVRYTREIDRDISELSRAVTKVEDSPDDERAENVKEMVDQAVELEKKIARLNQTKMRDVRREVRTLQDLLADTEREDFAAISAKMEDNVRHIDQFQQALERASRELKSAQSQIPSDYNLGERWDEKVGRYAQIVKAYFVGNKFDARGVRRNLVIDLNEEVSALDAVLVGITMEDSCEAGEI